MSKLVLVCWPLVNIQIKKINFDCLESTLSPSKVDADSLGMILPTDFSPACFLSFWPALEADLGISQKIKDFSKSVKSGAAGAWWRTTSHRTHSESRKKCQKKCQVKVEFPREMGRGHAVVTWAPTFPSLWAIFSVRRWVRWFFSQLFLSKSFVNEQEGGGFMWMKSSWVELAFSWQLLQDLACVITSEKKIISSRRIFPLMSALAPVSWAVEVFCPFLGCFWFLFVCFFYCGLDGPFQLRLFYVFFCYRCVTMSKTKNAPNLFAGIEQDIANCNTTWAFRPFTDEHM